MTIKGTQLKSSLFQKQKTPSLQTCLLLFLTISCSYFIIFNCCTKKISWIEPYKNSLNKVGSKKLDTCFTAYFCLFLKFNNKKRDEMTEHSSTLERLCQLISVVFGFEREEEAAKECYTNELLKEFAVSWHCKAIAIFCSSKPRKLHILANNNQIFEQNLEEGVFIIKTQSQSVDGNEDAPSFTTIHLKNPAQIYESLQSMLTHVYIPCIQQFT
ncbi:hypothetical protein RFI_06506 [Reticulomyxa filosa]|uniref:Uncharacterized protein n=1 Tax=Reticulomyxa filosa TaxID=46433 RepID=X6NXK3_RETFI|nr:hypothetical protein RFI_06506 [Reticulomyxa filosa]|eukprot:ETO30613.1 hypothetical protein RFI_06506 [Reticulomyxa filosa]